MNIMIVFAGRILGCDLLDKAAAGSVDGRIVGIPLAEGLCWISLVS